MRGRGSLCGCGATLVLGGKGLMFLRGAADGAGIGFCVSKCEIDKLEGKEREEKAEEGKKRSG